MKTVRDLVDKFRGVVREKDEDNSHFTNAEIMGWLSFAQNYICARTPYLVKRKQAEVVDGQAGYSLPSNFRKLISAHYEGDKLEPVTRRGKDIRDKNWSEIEKGTPREYFIEGNVIYLIPTPSTPGEELIVSFISFASPLEELTQEMDIQHEVVLEGVVSYALFRGYKKLKQHDVGADYYREFEQAVFTARKITKDYSYDTNHQHSKSEPSGIEVQTPQEWGDTG